jgi:hypothetical protein
MEREKSADTSCGRRARYQWTRGAPRAPWHRFGTRLRDRGPPSSFLHMAYGFFFLLSSPSPSCELTINKNKKQKRSRRTGVRQKMQRDLRKKKKCAAAVVHASHAMLKMATRSDKGDFVGRDKGPRSLLHRSRQGHMTPSPASCTDQVAHAGGKYKHMRALIPRLSRLRLQLPRRSLLSHTYLLLLPTRHTPHLSGTFSIECILSLTFP